MTETKLHHPFTRGTALVLLMVPLAACGLTKNPEPEFPIHFELTLGAMRRVPYAASIWFAQVDEEWREDKGALELAVRVEFECKGERFTRILFRGEPGEPACGVRPRLLSVTDGRADGVIRATFELTNE
jgi:hypothetical protein